MALLGLFPGGQAWLQAAPAADPDSIEIGLITCSPHEEIYSLYGHTALRCHNLQTGEDLVFNYGVFNFRAPHFVLRFVFGLTDYELGVAPFAPFCEYYERWGSQVSEQVLNLTAEEKMRLMGALADNYRPENRVYRYNYFYDNCSTRPRDMIERNLTGRVDYGPDAVADGPTWRQLIHDYTKGHPWAAFGNDILLGVRADQNTTLRQRHFLPDHLSHDLQRAVVWRDGEAQPLVGKQRIIVPAGLQVVAPGFPLSPFACALVLLGVSLAVLAGEQLSRRTWRWFDVVLMTAQGLAGCVLLAMLFSEHPTVSTNLQLLLLNPLPLLFVWPVARGRRTRWFSILSVLVLLFYAGGLWQDYAEGMEILALCLLLRYWRHYNDK